MTMKIVVDYDIEETKFKLKRGFRVESGPVVFEFPALLKEELRGNVEGDTFWLQSTRPHMVNLPQRYFRGTLTQEDDHTVIEGKFQHAGFYRGAVLAVPAFLLCLPLGVMRWVLPLLALAVGLVGGWFSLVVYEKDEKAVIDFLNKL